MRTPGKIINYNLIHHITKLFYCFAYKWNYLNRIVFLSVTDFLSKPVSKNCLTEDALCLYLYSFITTTFSKPV